MPAQAKTAVTPFSLPDALRVAFQTNNNINLYLIRQLKQEAWQAKGADGKGRAIAAILAHMHNVRLMWLKAVKQKGEVPAKLEGETLTQDQAVASFEESWRALDLVLQDALKTDGLVKQFKPDAASFLAYLIAHDAHHRGQISMIARQAGHALPQSAMFGMWEWNSRKS